MSKVVVLLHLTLDGVMQAPGGPDEDRSGGFTHGGWAQPRGASVVAALGGIGEVGGMLFGRRTYESFYSFWPNQPDNPFTAALNSNQKYVASTTLAEPLPWINSTLLAGDAAAAIAELKRQHAKNLLILGSGTLVQSLMRRSLIDEYVLAIHPLVLGTGRRIFVEGLPPTELRLADSKTTADGVIVATYRAGEQ
jgi:dihydrofolate reductase